MKRTLLILALATASSAFAQTLPFGTKVKLNHEAKPESQPMGINLNNPVETTTAHDLAFNGKVLIPKGSKVLGLLLPDNQFLSSEVEINGERFPFYSRGTLGKKTEVVTTAPFEKTEPTEDYTVEIRFKRNRETLSNPKVIATEASNYTVASTFKETKKVSKEKMEFQTGQAMEFHLKPSGENSIEFIGKVQLAEIIGRNAELPIISHRTAFIGEEIALNKKKEFSLDTDTKMEIKISKAPL